MTASICAIILTYNEEKHIARCIESIKQISDRIIIIDSFSDDQTLKIASKFNVDIYARKFDTHSGQFNWVLDNVTIAEDWILRIDADEVLSRNDIRLCDWLSSLSRETCGVLFKRRICFLGRELKFGGFQFNFIPRLFRRGYARYNGREMDEHLIIEGKTAKYRDAIIIDCNLDGLDKWLTKHIRYAELEKSASAQWGRQRFNTRSKQFLSGIYFFLPFYLRWPFLFLYRYLFLLGFLDGLPGYYFILLQSIFYRSIVDIKANIKTSNENLYNCTDKK